MIGLSFFIQQRTLVRSCEVGFGVMSTNKRPPPSFLNQLISLKLFTFLATATLLGKQNAARYGHSHVWASRFFRPFDCWEFLPNPPSKPFSPAIPGRSSFKVSRVRYTLLSNEVVVHTPLLPYRLQYRASGWQPMVLNNTIGGVKIRLACRINYTHLTIQLINEIYQ